MPSWQWGLFDTRKQFDFRQLKFQTICLIWQVIRAVRPGISRIAVLDLLGMSSCASTGGPTVFAGRQFESFEPCEVTNHQILESPNSRITEVSKKTETTGDFVKLKSQTVEESCKFKVETKGELSRFICTPSLQNKLTQKNKSIVFARKTGSYWWNSFSQKFFLQSNFACSIHQLHFSFLLRTRSGCLILVPVL